MPMLHHVRTRHVLLLLLCIAIAAALQMPIAWAWAYLFKPIGYFENSTYVDAPDSTIDPPDQLMIENCHYELLSPEALDRSRLTYTLTA